MSVGTGSIKRASAKADKMEAPKTVDLVASEITPEEVPQVQPEEMPQVQPDVIPQTEPEVVPPVEPEVAQPKKRCRKPKGEVAMAAPAETKKRERKPKQTVIASEPQVQDDNQNICQLTDELPVYLL